MRTTPRRLRASLCVFSILTVLLIRAANLAAPADEPRAATTDETPSAERDRSPVDVMLTADEKHLLTVNQTAGTLSLIDLAAARVVAEVPCGERPSALALSPDEKSILVCATWSGELRRFALKEGSLTPSGRLRLGFEPRGVAVAPGGDKAYVALTTAHQVAVVDLDKFAVIQRIDVKRWPRYLALSPDGSRLAVGTSGDGGVAVVDTAAGKMLYTEEFSGINLGQMTTSRDGKYVYFPWMVYRHNPISSGNIKLGWVLASRIARVRLDGPVRREALSLDPQGKAVADPHGIALSPDEQTLVVSAAGTHELLVFRLADLPLQDYGGTDHIPPALLKDEKRFTRIEVGGRPMALRFSKDGRHVHVANYLLNAVQVVDLAEQKIARTIALGGPKAPSLARKGEAIFYDARRSLDQWYSCSSCHYEGHTNSVSMDTRNDGSFGTFKTVLSLRHVSKTPPYFWHGWQKDLREGVRKSMIDSMLGKAPSEADLDALLAFLDTLAPPPNPHRNADGSLTEAAQRGEKVFKSDVAGCNRCHSGPYFSDGRIHDVGTRGRTDVYKGYNTPSLVGVHERPLLLHDGRAKTLEEVLTGPHNPAEVTGRGRLSADQLRDLIAYLKSL